MANPKKDLYVGEKLQLNGVEMLNDQLQFPRPPSTVPLVWTLTDHTIGEFLEGNADRTFIQVLGLKVGVITITLTDGLLTTDVLDINVIAKPAPTPQKARIQVLPRGIPAQPPHAIEGGIYNGAVGDPYGE